MADKPMASTCELMCQPSASKAMELNHQPAHISTTIVTSVIHITSRVPRSAAWLPSSNTCSCSQSERVSLFTSVLVCQSRMRLLICVVT